MKQFIDLARQGKNEWWRYLSGLVLILLTQVVLFIAAKILLAPIASKISRINYTIVSYVEVIGSVALLLIGLILAVRIIHKRPFLTLITPHKSVDWKKIGKSFGVYFGLLVLWTVIDYILDPSVYQFRFNSNRFLTFAPVALILTPLQTTAEEVFFRGYLLQLIALWTHNRAALVAGTGVLFMAPHLANPEVAAGFWTMALYYSVIGAFFTIVTLKSNSLETAIGIHASTNLFLALIVNYPSGVRSESIFYCTEFDPVSGLVAFIITAFIFYLLMFGIPTTSKTSAVRRE